MPEFADTDARLAYLRWLGEMSAAAAQEDSPTGSSATSSCRPSGTKRGAPGSTPALVLGLIQVESNFRKFAVSASARAATCR